jgi:uncharacterized BrkB/YihY/UPF0761 family membrane protein
LWWQQLLKRIQEKLGRNHASMMSAGVASYALLSIFPALSVLISIYGLLLRDLATCTINAVTTTLNQAYSLLWLLPNPNPGPSLHPAGCRSEH